MRAVDLIRRKRDSGELAPEEIQQLIAAYTRGDVPDYQMSAWLMAVVLRGMTRPEIAALTKRLVPEYQPPAHEQRTATAS